MQICEVLPTSMRNAPPGWQQGVPCLRCGFICSARAHANKLMRIHTSQCCHVATNTSCRMHVCDAGTQHTSQTYTTSTQNTHASHNHPRQHVMSLSHAPCTLNTYTYIRCVLHACGLSVRASQHQLTAVDGCWALRHARLNHSQAAVCATCELPGYG